MKRRRFILTTSGAIAATAAFPNIIISKPKDKIAQIGLSSVMFRFWIDNKKKNKEGRKIDLPEIPEYFADRYKVFNIDYDSRHFLETTPEYLEKVKMSLQKTKSKLVNIQVNARYDLASSDEKERLRSVKFIKNWLDIAETVGSEALRANPGKRGGAIETSVKSLKELNDYALKKGVKLLAENHGGIEVDPDVHVKLVKEVGSENFGTLPDYGNYPNDESRYTRLEKIMPYAKLISAKTGLFDDDMNHTSFDFDRCMKIARDSGFKGVYAAEQWHRDTPADYDFEKISDWMIEKMKEYI